MAMRVAAYARVSTDRQAETQTIEQQVERLVAYARQQGWELAAEHIYRDDGSRRLGHGSGLAGKWVG